MTDRVDSQEAEDVARVIVSEWPFYAWGEDRVPAIAAILARLVREGQIRELEAARNEILRNGNPRAALVLMAARIAALRGEG